MQPWAVPEIHWSLGRPSLDRGMALIRTLLAFSLFALAVPAAAETTLQGILDCAASNTPQRSFSQRAKFVTTDQEQAERHLRATIYGASEAGKLRLNLQVSQPPDVAGTAILLRRDDGDDDMFVYLPALKKSRRVTGGMAASKVLGTNFSYSDIQTLFGALSNSQVTRMPDDTLGDTPVYRLEMRAMSMEGGDFERVVVALEQTHCVPLRVDFLDAGDELVRRLNTRADSIKQVGERTLATEFFMEDFVTGSTTSLSMDDIEFDERIPFSLFNPRGYYNPR